MSKSENSSLFKVSNEVYDFLSGLVKYVLPGLAALYLGLAAFWGFPKPEAVAGSITLLATFLGIFIGVSKSAYTGEGPKLDGELLVDIREEDGDFLTVALDSPIDSIRDQELVTFKVVTNRAPQE